MQVSGDPSSQRDYLAKRLDRLDASMTSDSLLLAMGSSLWASFLADSRDDQGEGIRQIWLETSLRGSEAFVPMLSEILQRQGRGTLPEAFAEYTRWTLFTGPRDDGDHFLLGSLFPPMTPRLNHTSYPAESAGLEAVEPLGASVVRFGGDGSRGGLMIRLDAETPSPLQADLVIFPAGASRPHLVELSLDHRGHAEAGVPWRGVREAFLLVRNPGPEGSAAHFHYAAQIDPEYPFDLASFSALPSPGGITLQWETSREIDVLGWNVYRSSSPSEIFQRVNAVTLPSGSDSVEDTDYVYQDTSVRPGRRYYYVIEAITVLGLPEKSIALSARAFKTIDSTP
jgi:hypothetical protein